MNFLYKYETNYERTKVTINVSGKIVAAEPEGLILTTACRHKRFKTQKFVFPKQICNGIGTTTEKGKFC